MINPVTHQCIGELKKAHFSKTECPQLPVEHITQLHYQVFFCYFLGEMTTHFFEFTHFFSVLTFPTFYEHHNSLSSPKLIVGLYRIKYSGLCFNNIQHHPLFNLPSNINWKKNQSFQTISVCGGIQKFYHWILLDTQTTKLILKPQFRELFWGIFDGLHLFSKIQHSDFFLFFHQS